MKNMLLPFGLFLLVVLPLTANDLKDRSGPNKPGKDITTIPKIGQDLYIIGPSVDYDQDYDYDIIASENDAMPAHISAGFRTNTVDTLAYVPADSIWNGQFIQSPGDAMMMMFKMPADGIIKGVNVPVYQWGAGEQEMTISLHKVSYPFTTDSTMYPIDAVDGSGWIGGYDMDSSGHMSIEGTTYSAGGTIGICNPGDAVVAGSQDPLGTTQGTGPAGVPTMGLLWPDGFVSANLTPEANPAQADNWMATADYGDEPELLQDEWIGVLFHSTGANSGDYETTGFYYEAGDGVVDPWVFAKFYAGCGGTSGNGGWHIRRWMINTQLAVELTGDRGPVFEDIEELPTTISTDSRTVSCTVSDDNPSGEAAGVPAVTLAYQLDSLTATVNSVSLSMTAGTAEDGTWEAEIPGQAAGSIVYWSLTAIDVNGNSTSSGTFSYFIFLSTLGNDLIYNNQAPLYGNLDYSATLYFYWTSVEQTGFDIWDASYGSLTSELLENYDVNVE